jgi:outer membrane protein assembly factor BamA
LQAGAPLAGTIFVRCRFLALTLLAACQPVAIGPAAPAPIALPCSSHRIGQVAVTGAPREAVAALTVLEGTLDEPDRTERIAGVATDRLRAQGYSRAAIAVSRRPGCRIDLAVAVTLGPRYRIDRITFDTDDAFPDAERRAVLEDALGTVNTVGGVYVEYRMVRALAELERRYRDAGWLQARLGTPRAAYGATGTVSVRVLVTAGRRFRIGSVKAVGVGPRARDAVLQSLGLRAGDYYDGPRIRAAIERARRKLARRVELRTNVADDRPEIDLEAIVEVLR